MQCPNNPYHPRRGKNCLIKPALSLSKGARRVTHQASRSIPLRGYSYRTEQTYVDWIKRYILFHQKKRHPAEMGLPEIRSNPPLHRSQVHAGQKPAAGIDNPCGTLE